MRVPALAELSLAEEISTTNGVSVWRAALDQPDDVVQRLAPLLSADERSRADAYGPGPRRRRFVVGRAVLRQLLGELTGTSPDLATFSYNRDGKPTLANISAGSSIHFNMSHSRDLALIAIAREGHVGIDVECTDASYPYAGIAARYFSPAERAVLAAAPTPDRRRAFFRIWVRKEAYLKGRGEGISEWIYDTDLSVVSPDGVVNPHPSGEGHDQDRWLIRDVTGLPPGFVASVAVERMTS